MRWLVQKLMLLSVWLWLAPACYAQPTEIRYASGEIARVGDTVDDNGQEAIVEKVVLTAEYLKIPSAKKETNDPGLALKWKIGLPVFRPITSKKWSGVKLLKRASK